MRVLFTNKGSCALFFEEAKNSFGVKSWGKLGKILGTSRSMVDNYRKGNLCIPESRFLILLNSMGEERRAYFLKITRKKDENWGRVIGGKKAYEINKKEFNKGRAIAKESIKKRAKYEFNVNMPLSEDLCEFIGALIGDGFTNKYGNLYQTQITGDRSLDSDYYYNILKPICESLFKISPKITEKDNTIRLNLYSKRLFEMLTKRFQFPAGIKCYSIKIPAEMLGSEEILLNSTLKGMFNTNGGIGIDKSKKYKRPYIRINYTSASKDLINQLSKILDAYSIPHSVHRKGNSFMVQINGPENVRRFISKIGFSNKRHLDKIDKYL